MCWSSKNIPVKKVVEDKPLIVYKVFNVTKNGKISSPIHNNCHWIKGNNYKTTIGRIQNYGEFYPYIIEEGFHSLSEMPICDSGAWETKQDRGFICFAIVNPNIKRVAFECAVPVGAEYYINEDGYVVSNELILMEDLSNKP